MENKENEMSDNKKISNHYSPLMLVGTGSDVGKSVLAAGICRIMKQDGLHPAPYKSQNMALNSYVTPQGGEIGRAQAVQAEACGIACSTDMNPVLLKPNSNHSSQVVLNGKPVGNYSASAYYREQLNTMLLEEAMKAYNRLSAQYHPIVIEGAGSISELNLKQRDIANMRIAMATGAATILVADIDRGGVFGSVYGSIALLDEDERRRIKGIIINKFRGDLSLFDEGRKLLEELTGVPVLGVVPYFTNIHIEEEDSVALAQKSAYYEQGKVNVVVVLLGRMANYTDFDALEHDSRVHLYYSNNTAEITKADIIILPGSKNTLHDLMEIQRNGVAEAIVRAAKAGKYVVGICGGYQMMGQWIEDPEGTEGDIPRLPGLGLLPVTTVITSLKETRQCTFRFKEKDTLCTGYEIHMGRTARKEKAVSLNKVDDNTQEGCRVSDRVWGTYMHGILDNSVVREDLLGSFQQRLEETMDYAEFKDRQYDLLADHLRDYIDVSRIYEIMKEEA